MATQFKPCSIEACKGNAHHSAKGARGWCVAHWKRWRKYGDPTAGRAMWGEPLRWIVDHVKFAGEECLIWPFATYPQGYAHLRIEGADFAGHQIMCLLAHGTAPSDEHEVAHRCGNGNIGCINPMHLRWATRLENMADKIVHGRQPRGSAHPRSKLTEAEVREIRALQGKTTIRAAGAQYNVGAATIQRIWDRTNWGWLV